MTAHNIQVPSQLSFLERNWTLKIWTWINQFIQITIKFHKIRILFSRTWWSTGYSKSWIWIKQALLQIGMITSYGCKGNSRSSNRRFRKKSIILLSHRNRSWRSQNKTIKISGIEWAVHFCMVVWLNWMLRDWRIWTLSFQGAQRVRINHWSRRVWAKTSVVHLVQNQKMRRIPQAWTTNNLVNNKYQKTKSKEEHRKHAEKV